MSSALSPKWTHNRRVSPSGLVLHDDCSLAAHYRYDLRLSLQEPKANPTMSSGTAVHYAVEHFTLNYGGILPTDDDLEALGRECLLDEFCNDWDGPDKSVKKFLPGVLRALKRVPEWVWLGDWVSERHVEATFYPPEHDCASGDECLTCGVTLHGYPDIFRLRDDEGVPTVEIVDVKTTETDPLQYLLWTPQLRMYAAVLKQMHPNRIIIYRYLCVPTGIGKPTPEPTTFIYTEDAHAETIKEILAYASTWGEPPRPRYSRRCSWCQYKSICMSRMTGANEEGIIRELYGQRDESTER
jgi:hypothetical protein